MDLSKLPGIDQAARLLGGPAHDAQIREAAWIARCVGRGEAAPLTPEDLATLAQVLRTRTYPPGTRIFPSGQIPDHVWILRHGRIELSVGSGTRRTVIGILRPGDVDGDIQHLLAMPLPYTARALDETTCLILDSADFERVLATRPHIARRWLSSIAMRLATSQHRILNLLGRTLTQQTARLLLDEAIDGQVPLPQSTLAAMLGVRRPSLNKILKELERDGVITIRYAAIEITAPETLADRTG
ncbi:Crp/Fnr family transcriptional regulator [Actinocorallia sp. B10E7]|uniref:Crp/Fnr family transcriptional regulator n=1 Tax=Actinocorallia sp. B10E7 TaxID=3153558 RepID=UPI00325F0242